MRRFLQLLKTTGIIVLAAGCVLFALLIAASPVFEQGEGYELSLGSSSSARQIFTDCPALDKLLHTVKGESVRYVGNRYEELKNRFHAELVFTEEACGVTNYYCYTPLLGSCVSVNGYDINLHIAVSEGQTAAGTPLIFGGF